MPTDRNREIIGRRDRPAKPPLSRDVIVATALGILEKDGLSGLSLRRVAAALDTGASSLYVYLANLNELYALMLDHALSEMPLPEDSGQFWRERLKTYLAAYLGVLNRRRGLAELAMSTLATGTNSLRMWEVLLGFLKEGGIADTALVAGVDMLLLHVTAIAKEESSQRAHAEELESGPNALADVPASQFPLATALFKRGMFSGGGNDDARVEWQLDVILDGIGRNQKVSWSPSTAKRKK